MTPYRIAGMLAAAWAAALPACTAAPAADGGERSAPPPDEADAEPVPGPSPGLSNDGGVACAEGALHYLAFLASGTCRDVDASAGRWTGRTLFPDALPPIRDVACDFTWTTDPSRGDVGSPDIAALDALDAEHLTPACAKAIPSPATPWGPGSATKVPVPEGPESAPTGVTGCDVCGRLFRRDVFVILPADRVDLKRIVVSLDIGGTVSFDLTPAMAGAQAFFVPLPPPPAGATYIEGRVPFLDVH